MSKRKELIAHHYQILTTKFWVEGIERNLIMRLMEIRKILKHKSSKKNKESTLKFAPTVKKQYGVKVAVLNELVKRLKNLILN